jgi:hypothetical protein
MNRRTISKETQQALAHDWVLHLDGSDENCMDVTTRLDEHGLTLTGSLESIIEAIVFIALEVGGRRNDDEGDDLVNGLVNPHLMGPNSGGEFAITFPGFTVA